MQKIISSASNEDLKQLARLVQNVRERRKSRQMVLEGIHLLEAALDVALVPTMVFVNEDAAQRSDVQALLARLPSASECIQVARGVFAKVTALSSAPEVLAVCPRPEASKPQEDASRLLLEDIQDPGNLGTILRSAAAADVREVYLSKGCVDVFSPKVLRSGMGAHFALSIHEGADLAAELAAFTGRKLVTHLAGSTSLYGQDLSGPIALVLGNEGSGVSDALVSLSDVRVRIPMPGHAESLNVAMAATICLFERVRQLQC
ncbi:RNA methyltransferase [Rhodobacteraceae bacterium CH30]|nr:RNA methyltransferase [Rhodobacteraceae bacterium CH30]